MSLPNLYLGLMSGTSQDGVDAVVARFRDGHLKGILGHYTTRYPPGLRERLLRLAGGSSALSLREYARADTEVARQFARAANGVLRRCRLRPGRIAAIGSHGQTVFHDPSGTLNSLQLGNPSLIARLTGVTTVADFRRADMALGGQGAPLVPAFHASQFGSARETRVVVNIGGIANISVLPRRGPVTGFDTGPGNGLLDEWIHLHHGRAYDANGRWAARGSVHPRLLQALLSDTWFRRPPPKSTGRGHFNLTWVRKRYPGVTRLQPADVQRTLVELTARTVARAVARHAPGVARVLVCGGGTHNATLMSALGGLLAPVRLESTAEHGVDPRHVEATAFAWLAMRTLEGKPGNVPEVTGAKRPVVLGGTYPKTT